MRSAFLKDLLTPAKVFSLLTQKQDLHIIETVEGVEKNQTELQTTSQKGSTQLQSVI